MDGPFYNDSRPPFPVTTSPSAITLTGSYQPIVPTAWMRPLGNYFNWVGKLVHLRLIATTTSGATPGTFNVGAYWGNNTAGNGTQLCAVGFTWNANNVNVFTPIDLFVRCRALGTSGSLFAYGTCFLGGSGIIFYSFNNPAAVTVDLTQPNYLSVQLFRSGSTAETVTTYDVYWQTLN
jgi:hypothetical protein